VIPDAGPAATLNSDMALVRRAMDGDGDAFASLFQLHKHRVYAVILRMTNNPAEADDLTQDVFIQVFRKLCTFRGESALSTWLHRIAVTTALMHFRRQGPHQVSLDETREHDAIPPTRREHGRHDDRLRCSLDRISLTRALETLPKGYRTIFELHEIQGYGHREIARLLHCSVGNSKSQLHKAKERMRECLSHSPGSFRYLQKACSSRVATPSKRVSTARDPGFHPSATLAIRRVVRKSVLGGTPSVLVLGSSNQSMTGAAAS
jgi:RNA polymerase sigma-70 factor (ECF subfamily)